MSLAELAAVVLLVSGGFQPRVTGADRASHARGLAEADGWVRAHPGDPDVPRALLWMAQLRLVDGQPELAEPLLDRAWKAAPTTAAGTQADKLLGDLALHRGDYKEAIARYQRVAASPSQLWRYQGEYALRDARARQRTWWSAFLVAIALGGFLLLRAARARRSLWPLPEPLLGALPALALVAAAVFAVHHRAGILALAAGAALLFWVNGATWRAHPPRRLREGALLLAQLGALAFCVLVLGRLWPYFAFVFAVPD